MAGDVAALSEDLLVERDPDRLARLGLHRRHGRVPNLDRLHASDAVGGREEQGVADAQHAGLDTADEDPLLIELVDVLNGKAQRPVHRRGQRREAVKRLQQRRSGIPRHVRRAVRQVVAVAGGHRHDHRRRHADVFEVARDLVTHLVEAGKVVIHQVHLVDDHGDLPQPQQMQQIGVPARLFAHAFVSIDHQHGGVAAGCPADHVLQELAVSRSVDDDVVAGRGLEPDLGRVDRHSLVAFGLESVQDEGPLQRHAPLLADEAQFLELAFRQAAGVMQQTSDQRRLAVVDMADDDDLHLLADRRPRANAIHGLSPMPDHM